MCHTSVCQPLTRCERLVRAVLVLSFHTAAAPSYLSSFINFSHFTVLTNAIRLLPLRAWPGFDSPAPSLLLSFSLLPFLLLRIFEPFLGLCNHRINKLSSRQKPVNFHWSLSWRQGRIFFFFLFQNAAICQRYERIPAAVRTSVFADFVHRPMDKGTSPTVDQNSHLPFSRRRRNWN